MSACGLVFINLRRRFALLPLRKVLPLANGGQLSRHRQYTGCG